MRYSDEAPYEVLSTGRIDAATLQRIKRFARYWDLVGNSGRFPRTLPRLLGDAPFARFMDFADAMFASTRRTHGFAVEELYGQVHAGLMRSGVPEADASMLLALDYRDSGARGRLPFATPGLGRQRVAPRPSVTLERQRRHLRD